MVSRVLLLVALAAGSATSCAESDHRRPLTLYAASSWADVAPDLEAAFEDAHPEWDLRVQLAGSQVLRVQIEAGASADAFVSADADHAHTLRALGWSSRPVARNTLAIIAPETSRVVAPEDLVGARWVMAAAEVPVGRYARRALVEHGLRAALDSAVSFESNTRLVRAKVLLGEADAAIVYATDARGVDVRVIPLPLVVDQPTYHLALGPEPSAGARALRAYLHGPGQRILLQHGFLTP